MKYNFLERRFIMLTKKYTTVLLTVLALVFTLSVKAEAASPAPKKIPAGVVEASNHFGLWTDIYNSNQKVVVYSYKKGSTCPYQSQEFHNKVSAAAASSAGKYKVRPTGPDLMQREVEPVTQKLQAKAKNVKTQEDMQEYNKEVQAFNKLLRFTNQCTLKACIIDPSKGEYVLMHRVSEEAVQTIKSY